MYSKYNFSSEVTDLLDYNIVVSKFEHQSRSKFTFELTLLGKGMNPLIPTAIGQITPHKSFYRNDPKFICC